MWTSWSILQSILFSMNTKIKDCNFQIGSKYIYIYISDLKEGWKNCLFQNENWIFGNKQLIHNKVKIKGDEQHVKRNPSPVNLQLSRRLQYKLRILTRKYRIASVFWTNQNGWYTTKVDYLLTNNTYHNVGRIHFVLVEKVLEKTEESNYELVCHRV